MYNEKSVSLALSIDKKGALMEGTHEIEFVKGQTLTHMVTWEEEVDRVVVVLVVGRWGTESNEGEESSLLLLISPMPIASFRIWPRTACPCQHGFGSFTATTRWQSHRTWNSGFNSNLLSFFPSCF